MWFVNATVTGLIHDFKPNQFVLPVNGAHTRICWPTERVC
jgi:hypothetical protein